MKNKPSNDYVLHQWTIRTLKTGVFLASLFTFIGSCLFLSEKGSMSVDYKAFIEPKTPYFCLSDLALDSYQMDPEAITLVGIILLILVPIARVFISIFGFIAQKDLLYVWISVTIFLILTLSFSFGCFGPFI